MLVIDAEKAELEQLLGRLVMSTAPRLVELFGVGIDTATTLLVTAGDNLISRMLERAREATSPESRPAPAKVLPGRFACDRGEFAARSPKAAGR